MRLVDLWTLGACATGATAAADQGERFVLACLVIAGFWTAVRMIRECPR